MRRLIMWRWGNLLLAFLVELVALGVFAWWGWETGGTTATRWLLALGLPLVAAIGWGLFAAPTARRTTPALRWTVKVLVFGLAGAALWSLGHALLGVAFVVVVAANLLIIHTQNLQPAPPKPAG
ncbi:YrdB family protein [Kribbella solani]|uniref:YrdB family protein n=1 Tax=Kribbella solani TaxID=236067 RepID=UPI0029B9EC9B|nr:YrdB family protein [Kribbella solani]MDX2972621.1 YrdB family protein [Kribbella solani]